MRKRVVLNSPRLREIRRKKHKSKRKKITVSGNKIIETKDIENIVNSEISGHYLLIFPKTNFLIYPKNKIISELNTKYKRLKGISINVNNVRTLEVNVSEYQGRYLYCGLLIPLLRNNLNDNKCYFADSDGYIFDEAPYFSGDVYFKFYGDVISKNGNPSGSYFMKDNFSKIIEFKNILEKINLKPTAFWIDNNNNEGNFSLEGEPLSGPRVTFKIDSDYQKLAENLQAAISVEPLRTNIKTKLSSLLYLDLRFGNKVYYKFQ